MANGQPSQKATFDYAWCLVRSRNKTHVKVGLHLLEGMNYESVYLVNLCYLVCVFLSYVYVAIHITQMFCLQTFSKIQLMILQSEIICSTRPSRAFDSAYVLSSFDSEHDYVAVHISNKCLKRF